MSSSSHPEQKRNQWMVLILIMLVLVAILAVQIATYYKVTYVYNIYVDPSGKN
jgi:hypothetical protein